MRQWAARPSAVPARARSALLREAERARADGVRVRGYVSTVLGCPYQGEVPLADVVRVSSALHALGCYEVSLGDTIGVGTPGMAMRASTIPLFDRQSRPAQDLRP